MLAAGPASQSLKSAMPMVEYLLIQERLQGTQYRQPRFEGKGVGDPAALARPDDASLMAQASGEGIGIQSWKSGRGQAAAGLRRLMYGRS